MTEAERLKRMALRIERLRKNAEELKELAGESFPSVERNAARILASVRMLELAVTDIVDLVK